MAVELASTLLEFRRLQPSSLFLRKLSSQDLQRLAENATVETHQAHTSVFRAGQPAKHFHLVLTGVWKISQTTDTGAVLNLAFISTGQVVGVYSVLGAVNYNFSADVMATCKVLSWPIPVLRSLAQVTPQIAWNLCEILSRWVAELADRYRELMTENAEQRVAHAVLRIAWQMGERDGRTIIINTPLSLEDMAGYAGTTLFTISRILRRWQREGLLQRNRNFVTLYDLESIEEIANAVDVMRSSKSAASGGHR